jgi:uncharacterized protein (TIGR02231 family)
MTSSLLVLVLQAGPAQVVVYPDRAQVRRVETIRCGSAVAVVFDRVSPSALADSFRAESREGSIEGLRAEKVTLEQSYAPQIEALKVKQQILEKESQVLRDELARAQQRGEYGESLSHVATHFVSRELTAEKPNIKAWQQAFESSLATRIEADAAVATVRVKLESLAVEQAIVNDSIAQASLGAQKEAYRVEVLASCKGESAKVTLTYLVAGARWEPSYEARLTPSGASELSLWATVSQSTGESWADVELTLSTAVGAQNATPPRLNKLMVSAYERKEEKKQLVARSEVVAAAVSGSTAASNVGGEVRAIEQGLSVQLEVPGRSTVSELGKPTRVFVGKATLAGSVALKTTPKVLPAAFRVAEVTNTAPWPLISGPLEAYRGSGFVGRYQLERVPQGGTFNLTFGLEETVRVRRSIVQELRRETGLFKDKIRFTYVYEFEVGNYGRVGAEVQLIDQTPVIEVNDITVTVLPETTTGFQRNEQSGIVTWPLKLTAGERKKVKLAFAVDVPTTYDLGGL